MTVQIPKYLRVHVDENGTSHKLPPADDVSSFWQAYVDATGWRVDKSSQGAGRPKLLPVASDNIDDLESVDQQPAISKKAAERLAKAASRIADRLREFEGSLSRIEGALAVEDVRAVGVHSQGHISERLASILIESTIAAGCDAAGLYLLDDDTSTLKLRACHGLPKSKLSDPARPLRGALGDLEALVSDIVTIDDIERMTHWHSPEERGAAIAIAVRAGDLPLGTLWLWDDSPREFTNAQLAAAKLAAGRIAAELERETIDQAASEQRNLTAEMRDAAGWQSRQLPPPIPLAKHWEVSGWSEPAKQVGGDWYGWDILPDGMIAITIASTGQTGVEAGLTAAIVRSAWQAHCGYRHDTGQLLGRINDTLWQTSTGDQLTSILYANIDPDTGEGFFASAGNCHAFVVNKYGYRAISSPTQPLGTDPDQHTSPQSLRLLHGDALVLVSDGLLACNGAPKSGCLTQQELNNLVRDHLKQGPEEALSALRRTVASPIDREFDRSIVVLARD